MVKKQNILIFPAGSEIGHDIFDSLRYNLHVEVFGASGKPDDARLLYDEDHYFEDQFYIDRPDFIDTFNALLIKHQIDFIFPTHDTIALYLAEHASELKSKVLTSSYETALIAREKRRTYDLFQDANICPVVYSTPQENTEYPVFLKPNIGEGAKRTLICNDEVSVITALAESPDLLVCEFLPGEELSVDCFTDRNRNLLFVGPRTRDRIQMGISFHSASVPVTEEISKIAEMINQKLEIRGAWFFQIKKDKHGSFKLLEFAVRQSSTMGLYRQVGVNFALLSLFDAMDLDVKIIQNKYPIELERSLYNRYKHGMQYSRVYIDFDDCIIVNDAVNDSAVRYLYYCQRAGKKVSLLTKHKFDIAETLEKYKLHSALFDEIISIAEDEDKASHIKQKDSIFIDNYYFDRENVKNELGIPVFDVDAIESLIEAV